MKQYIIVIFIAVCTSVLTLRPPAQAQGITAEPTTISWSPDGQKIAIGAFNDGVWISSVDGTVSQILDIGLINDFAWSPDSNRLAILRSLSFFEANIEIWDLTEPHNPQLLSVMLDDGVDIQNNSNIDWHPTSNLLAVSGKGVRIWNADTGQLLREVAFGLNHLTSNTYWSPDGNALLGIRITGERQVFYWDSQSDTLTLDNTLGVNRLRWADDPQSFVAGTSDSSGVSLVIASVSQPNTVLSTLPCHVQCPTMLDWQGNTLAGSLGADVTLWDISTQQIITTITGLAGPGFALDPSGSRLAYIQEGSLELVIVPVPSRPQPPDIPPPASN